jgi:hypothetical protein
MDMLKRWRLSREIILMMIVKLALIYSLYFLCFSHPIDKTLSSTDIAAHLIKQ